MAGENLMWLRALKSHPNVAKNATLGWGTRRLGYLIRISAPAFLWFPEFQLQAFFDCCDRLFERIHGDVGFVSSDDERRRDANRAWAAA
jgi:hypothetical protein